MEEKLSPWQQHQHAHIHEHTDRRVSLDLISRDADEKMLTLLMAESEREQTVLDAAALCLVDAPPVTRRVSILAVAIAVVNTCTSESPFF